MALTSKVNSRFTHTTQNFLESSKKQPVSVNWMFNAGKYIFQDGYSVWFIILPGLILFSLFALPLLSLTLKAFNPEFLQHVFSEQSIRALQLSLGTSLVTVLITVAAGTPLAYILARWKFPSKAYVEVLIDLPIVLPPSVAGVALLIAFGRQGVFGVFLHSLGISLPFTTAAVVVAQLFVAAPLYVRAARIGFADIDLQVEEAARVEGANQWQLFRHVMFPLAGQALLSGAILTWTRALGEFGATILFAGNLEGVTQTMPMAIYLSFERKFGLAIALSVVLVVISAALLSFTRRLQRQEQ